MRGDAGATDAGASDGGEGETCGAMVCGSGERCCTGCTLEDGFCVPGGMMCPAFDCPPPPITRCEDALAIGASGLPCTFEGGCGSTEPGCCSSLAECIDGATRVETTCAPDCGGDACRSNSDCAPYAFCDFPSGACGGVGTCSPRPDACTADCPGVCGCDGAIYCNACTANASGVSVAGSGGCATPPPMPMPPPPPPSTDCRDTGCPEGQSCELCWTTYACLPAGAIC